MVEIVHFELEFVQRTKETLQNYQGEYKLSNAINCTLGLIILPNEIINNIQDPFWDTLISDIEQLAFLQINQFEPIHRITNGNIEYYPKTLKILLKKIRNGLAHQNIEPVNNNGFFSGVIIRNYYGGGNNRPDLEIEFNRNQLERFALFIADEYLKVVV
uniref:pEK499-p136 HEPN domain-containing protein n=1 Tax=candidate division WOR-3 bacterium TaxID=2052148 RepID=A0A7V3KNL1_UNCW3